MDALAAPLRAIGPRQSQMHTCNVTKSLWCFSCSCGYWSAFWAMRGLSVRENPQIDVACATSVRSYSSIRVSGNNLELSMQWI